MTRPISRRPSLLATNVMTDHNRLLVVGTCQNTLSYARKSAAERTEVETLSGLFSAYWSGGSPPDIVAAPLLAQTFDILDVVERLNRFGFKGQLQAVTVPLPNARAVRREIAAECQDYRFELVECTAEPNPPSPSAP